MHILSYVGSPRKDGNTRLLFNEFLGQIEKKGHTISIAPFPDKVIHPCIHCGGCTDNNCKLNDEITPVVNTFCECDGLVIFTPIYFFQFSAQTKAFIDRLGCLSNWSKKFISLVVVSGSKDDIDSGFDLVYESVVRMCAWKGADFIGCYHKVTEDKKLPITPKDKISMQKLIYSMEMYVGGVYHNETKESE